MLLYASLAQALRRITRGAHVQVEGNPTPRRRRLAPLNFTVMRPHFGAHLLQYPRAKFSSPQTPASTHPFPLLGIPRLPSLLQQPLALLAARHAVLGDAHLANQSVDPQPRRAPMRRL